jgi:hypothetical protein
MNRNLDGSLLSDEQLFDICRDIGFTEAELSTRKATLHNPNMLHSWLREVTCKRRFDMWTVDKVLKLDTRRQETK